MVFILNFNLYFNNIKYILIIILYNFGIFVYTFVVLIYSNNFTIVYILMFLRNFFKMYSSTVSHRSEYTPHIFVNILLYLFMGKHGRNDTLLQCKVVSVQLV